MTNEELEIGGAYLAHCGSLAPVMVIETAVAFAFPGQVAPKKIGASVVAIEDVPDAADWADALAEHRPVHLAHRRGEEFIIPARYIERLAETDLVFQPRVRIA